MPSDKRNSITVKAMGLIFSLFDIALTQEVPLAHCSMYNAFFMDLPVTSFAFHSQQKVLIWQQDVIASLRSGNCLYFYSGYLGGYFDCRGAFQTILDFYCYVTG